MKFLIFRLGFIELGNQRFIPCLLLSSNCKFSQERDLAVLLVCCYKSSRDNRNM